jgi:hypothetical protein
MESFFSSVKSEAADRFTAAARPRWNCSTTSKCSITIGAGIRHPARLARPLSNDGPPKRRNPSIHRIDYEVALAVQLDLVVAVGGVREALLT